MHCQFPEFCEDLIDDKGDIYTASTHLNKTLFSYGRPIYHLHESSHTSSVEVFAPFKADAKEDETDSFVLASEKLTPGNSTSRNLVTCYPGARKIRLKSNTASQIAMYEFEAYSSGVNVALQGTAIQSSNRNNGNILYASNAIDGNFSTFSHTNDLSAMFEVDLGDTYPIETVHILNRNCGKNPAADPLGCWCRLSNATLTLLDETDSVVETSTFGDTCGLMTVSESFTENYNCLAESPTGSLVTKTPINYPSSQPALHPTASHDNLPATLSPSTLPTADPVGGHDDVSSFEDAIMSLKTEDSIALVYSGSRWFGTLEHSAGKDFGRLDSLCK